MIKFLCASCGERLSVPDQNAGRKGVCPTCHAINRIPLKGFVETAPNTPTVAKSGEQRTSTVTRPSEPPAGGRSFPAERPVEPAKAEPIRRPEQSNEPFQNFSAIFNEPGHLTREAASFADTSEHVEIYVERRLPRRVKIVLLILAALAIVGALYFALYSALHAFVQANS